MKCSVYIMNKDGELEHINENKNVKGLGIFSLNEFGIAIFDEFIKHNNENEHNEHVKKKSK